VAAAALSGGPVALVAQQKPAALGQVRIGRAVQANGQPLAAGTYTLRLTGEQGRPVVGQTPAESQWVEFVQGSEVKGRELATVLSAAEAKKLVKGGKLPASGSASAELLRGGDYIRVWMTRGGSHYLLHLAVAP
jgi:hypothetical protein